MADFAKQLLELDNDDLDVEARKKVSGGAREILCHVKQLRREQANSEEKFRFLADVSHETAKLGLKKRPDTRLITVNDLIDLTHNRLVGNKRYAEGLKRFNVKNPRTDPRTVVGVDAPDKGVAWFEEPVPPPNLLPVPEQHEQQTTRNR